MKRYEYKQERNVRTEHILTVANREGQDGWELVYVRGGNNFIFKREIPAPLTSIEGGEGNNVTK